MKNLLLAAIFIFVAITTNAQEQFSNQELSINAFRNPSIGMEYRQNAISLHLGYYITAFDPGITTQFIKIGISTWFMPLDNKEIPSSFYAGASYLYGLNLDYKDKSAFAIETGVRWMIWDGLNFRLGIIALASADRSLKINPTPAISYSFLLK